MRTRNVLSLASLFVLGIVAACAQGTSDVSGTPGSGSDGGLGTIEGGTADGASTTRFTGDSGSTAPGDDDDSSTPTGDDDSSTPTGDDASSGGQDSGIDSAPPPIDAGHDSGSPASVLPTKCSQTNEGTGCCYDNNNYYCNELDEVHEVKCTGGQVCGWVPADKYYGCTTSASADPSGTYPIACQ